MGPALFSAVNGTFWERTTTMKMMVAGWVSVTVLTVLCSVQGEIVPLYFVGTNTQASAQMALDVVTGTYPSGTSLANYPPPVDTTVPESVVAAAVRLYITNDLSGLVNLYEPSERSNVTVSSMYLPGLSNAVDITFDRFYWIGNKKLITYRIGYNAGVGFLKSWVDALNYVDGRFYLTMSLDSGTLLVSMYGYNVAHGFTAPLAGSYRYALTYPPSGGLHPLRVLFNGTAMKLRIDTNTVASDQIESFVTNLVTTFRSGDVNSILALWSVSERPKLAELANSDPTLFKAKMATFNVPKTYLIFKLDFGPNAIVCYENTDANGNPMGGYNGVGVMTLFKDANGQYLLTEQNLGGQVLFDSNLRRFISAPVFIDFILQQVPP
jgi:hypothetical protein